MPEEPRLLSLPIDPFVPRVVAALRSGHDVVLVAEPGAGKTTRIAPGIVRSGLLGGHAPRLVMLQPRRVAARAAAARIAQEQGWELGREVGYQVRFERVMSRDTRLAVLTEGVLVRKTVSDPELSGIGCVILDEFHERSVHSDLALAMLREAKALRPELRLVVMSATLDADAVADYLIAAGKVEIFHVPGRLFPVEVAYAGDSPAPVDERVANVLRSLWERPADRGEDPNRDVLVFLPGVREIERAMDALRRLAHDHGYDVLPLHGSLTKEEQDAAVRFDPTARPRVLCATNIAETSLTLPGVSLVIDSGLVRQAGYDAVRGVETLDTVRISKASADQRCGRAGRVAAGRCIRLWSKMTQHRLADFEVPEILRVDLAEAVLAVRAWGGDPITFGWFQRPDDRLLEAANVLLELLGAVKEGRLTRLGESLQHLPLHPRAARLVSAAPQRLRMVAATVAALLAEGAEAPGRRTANVHELLDAFERRALDPVVWRMADRARGGLLHLSGQLPATGNDAIGGLEELLLLAYPDRVCRRRDSDPGLARLVNGGGVRVPDPSAVRGSLFLALDVRRATQAQAQQADVRLVAEIQAPWLEKHFPDAMTRETSAELVRGRVLGVRRRRYRDLVLEEERTGSYDPERAVALLADAMPAQAAELAGQDPEFVALANRLTMLEGHLPRHLWPAENPPPASGDLDLIEDAARLSVANGEASVEGAHRRLAEILQSRVSASPWHRALQFHAPETLEVPSGSRVRLDWTNADAVSGRGPVLAVRLQELFGLQDTPRVCGGQVHVVLQLLGPNYRPVQVTEDLASFWRNTYPQVRKDLRARYPRHSWPEDPLVAPAVRGVRRRSGA